MGKKLLSILVTTILCFSSIGNSLSCIAYAISNDNLKETEIIKSESEHEHEHATLNEGVSETTSEEAQEEWKLTSDEYEIADLNSYITRVIPKTTIQEFKKGFNVSEEKVHVYANSTSQTEVQDGIMKTNMCVKFDEVDTKYTISVIGDINGDGLANQIEVQKLIWHVVRKKRKHTFWAKLCMRRYK